MAEAGTDIPPAGWQVTATTIECDMVDEYVTIMVYGDWSCRCTWWAKYKKPATEGPGQKFPKQIKAKIARCQGPYCKYVTGYRDKLVNEETAADKNK